MVEESSFENARRGVRSSCFYGREMRDDRSTTNGGRHRAIILPFKNQRKLARVARYLICINIINPPFLRLGSRAKRRALNF